MQYIVVNFKNKLMIFLFKNIKISYLKNRKNPTEALSLE